LLNVGCAARMNTHAVFEEVIDESMVMQPLHPEIFDDFLAEGWRLLGYSLVRHNYSVCRGKFCRTIPLRIRLEGFEFSSGQKKLLRRHAQIPMRFGTIALTPAHEAMFLAHAQRFSERRPAQLSSFLGPLAHREPVPGYELSLIDTATGAPFAHSYIHVGKEAVSGTYCFFHPEWSHLSPGTLTMLLEIEKARTIGKKYYYHGYCYDVPSQFDYKLNFNNLECMDWKTGLWSPCRRQPVRRWTDLVEKSGDENVGL
jgi:leucyl-tRNA---protein transferase